MYNNETLNMVKTTDHVSSDLQVEVHKYSNQISQSEK